MASGGDQPDGNDEINKPSTSQVRDEPDISRNISRRGPFSDFRDNIEIPAREDVINETNGLYLQHLAREISELGMELGNQLRDSRFFTRPSNLRSLRELADRFAESPQRQWVLEQAQNVDLDSLNSQNFQQLLNGLFQEDGATWERVLVLFYFCTDLSIRAIQEKFINYFVRIYNWTTVFFSGRFSYWIQQQGGWSAVLGSPVDYTITAKLSLLGVCCATVLALCYFLKSKK
ncbi:apoptosis regulator BAX-like [Cylas formicarius]|uniref:apoptosis regulator BAX-like n=1 Tax=Cylas formicarius TaxID=197179 RepID=UPI00295839A0|nr:apoptosis regulator BAX-like [Cylas formicarius]XP_060522766.1 apoptosis regulator BAX-like [Cylas formicarius]